MPSCLLAYLEVLTFSLRYKSSKRTAKASQQKRKLSDAENKRSHFKGRKAKRTFDGRMCFGFLLPLLVALLLGFSARFSPNSSRSSSISRLSVLPAIKRLREPSTVLISLKSFLQHCIILRGQIPFANSSITAVWRKNEIAMPTKHLKINRLILLSLTTSYTRKWR